MDDLLQRVRVALADSYDIEAEVGRGGMAVVYLGTDLRHKRSVAVKVLPPHLASAVGHERFLQEIRVAAGLSHPYILPLLDSGQADGLLYYVMPFVEGENLRERLARETQLAVEDALRIADEMAEALGHAHALGIVHRDVKPANILLSHEHACLADFGVAFALDRSADERLTGTGLSVGTPAYMSPQQGLADERIDGTSDQYSLACVIYEMLAGSPPFVASSPDAVLRRHVMDPVPAIRTVRPSVPAAVEAALTRALSKSPNSRFPSMEAFAVALRAPDSNIAFGTASPGRRAALVVGGGLVLAAAAFGLSVLAGGNSSDVTGGSSGRGPVGGASAYRLALLPCQAVESADSILGNNVANGVYLGLRGFPSVSVTPYEQSEAWARDHGIPRLDAVATALDHLHASTLGECTVRRIGTDSVDVDYKLYEADRLLRAGTVRLPRTGEGGVNDDLLVVTLAGLLSDGSTPGGSTFRPTDDPDAYMFYFYGVNAFVHDEFKQAEDYFGLAVNADSGFALARWRMADARRWQADPSPKDIDLQRLFEEQADRLGTRDSLLLGALVQTPGPAAFDRFEKVLEQLPNDAYAMLLYGDELLHRGPLWGVTLDSVETVLEAATLLNTGFAPAWDHLAQVRIRLGMEEEADAAVRRVEELASPASATNPLPMDMIWRHGWRERFDPVAADTSRLKLQENAELLAFVARLVRYGDLPRAQFELGSALIEHPDTQPGDRLWHSGVNATGLALASLGWPDSASAAFSNAAREAPADEMPAAALFADQWAVITVALGLEGFSAALAEEAAERLAGIANDTSAEGLHRARAAWTLALRAASSAGASGAAGTESDADTFERWRLLVESLADADDRIEPLALHLAAVAFSRDDRWEDAIAASRVLVAYDSVGNTERPFARAAIYLTRGGWFEKAEEPDSAIAVWTWHLNTDLESVADRGVQAGEVDGAFGSHARLRIARLATRTSLATDRADLRERACSEAREVVRRWEESEPALADEVTEAGQIVDTMCVP